MLLVLPQLPQDPASGAARSTRTICEMLAGAGAEVHAVATTASERSGHGDSTAYLRDLGIDAHVNRMGKRPVLEFLHRGIHYTLLDVGPRDMHAWQKIVGTQFDLLFDHAIHSFKPDLLVAFGGLPGDRRRYQRARRQGVRIVFGLRNQGYLNDEGRQMLKEMDGILTPSRFLTNLYKQAVGLESTPLPVPVELEDVVASERDPIFFTMINPAPEKGLMLMARLAEELSVLRPDIPMMFVESRSSGGKLVEAGMRGGFDLRRHENLMMAPAMGQPKEIYLATRVLLAPSLVAEAAGRVAAEALLNGIPPIVSDRGGLPEVANGAGFTVPIPVEIGPGYPVPVGREVVQPWLELIIRLEGDEEFYQAETKRAWDASEPYRPENLAPRYREYFRTILDA